MSIFPSHDLSLNRYYYTFYSYHPDTSNVLNCLVYDQDQNLVETQDISFNGKTMSEMMAFLENSNTNPYAIGKAGADYRSMDLTFGTVYKKSFQEKQRQKLMTYLNDNYKNVHGTSQSVFTVSASGGKYYVDGYTDPAPNLFAPKEGYYVFDQSDSTNVSHPLVLSTQDGSSNYFSTMFTEGTRGSLNGYTIVDISAGTPDLYYYCTAHSGMGGQLLNFATAIPYTVSIVYNDTYGQDIYQVAELANYYTGASGIYLNTGSKYAIDVSVLNGTSFNPIIGTTNDVSSSIISDTSIVNQIGDVLYVRPVLSNLYLFDQTVALMTKPLENGYYVKTIQNWTGTSVFTLMEPTESTGIVQRNLSFNAGDVVLFHVGHSSMDNFNLVFGTTVDDVATALDSNYVSRSGDIITLDLSSYSGGTVYYFEDSSANMGYVEASDTIATNFSNTSQMLFGSATGDKLDRTWSQTQYGDFTNGTYNVIMSDIFPNGSYAEDILDRTTNRATSGLLTTNYIDGQALTTGSDAVITTSNGIQYYGGYIQVTMPYKLLVKNIYIDGPWSSTNPGWTGGRDRMPKKIYLFGSNDGTTFTFLKEDEMPYSNFESPYTSETTNVSNKAISGITEAYSTIRMVINSLWGALSTCNVVFWELTGDINMIIEDKLVTVTNGVFVIDGVSKDNITFTNGVTYVFDQSEPSNTGYPIVFGTSPESSTLYTNGVTVVGTPGQPGAYTKLEYNDTTGALYYYSTGGSLMGYFNGYAVKTVQNWTGQTVFSIKSPNESDYIVQPDLSFNAGDTALFYVGDSSMTGYSLVFGTVVDDNTTLVTSNYSETDNVITLDLTNYSGTTVYYFEDSSANMGYVSPPASTYGQPVFTYGAKFEPEFYTDANSNNINGTALNNLADSTKNATISTSTTANGTGSLTYYENISGRKCYFISKNNCSIDLPSNLLSDPSSFSFSAFYYVVKSEVNFYAQLYGCGSTKKSLAIGASTEDSNGIPGPMKIKDTGLKINMSGSAPYETWHHVCVTHNGTTNKTILYLDGVEVGSDDSEALNMVQPIKIGFGNATLGGFYIDAVSVYDKVLTANEVSGLFASNNAKVVTVSNGAFVIDGVSKPEITFTDGETYVFDQSDPSNDGFPIVFGSSPESSSLYTTGVTVVGTPGQAGAYTILDYNDTTGALYYYNNIIPGMGYDPNAYSYYVTVAGASPEFYLNSVQQAVTFTANTKYYFYQYDSTNTGYPIVFDETADDAAPYFTDGVTTVGTPGQSGSYTILDLSAGFTGPLVYFSSGATGMGY